MKSTAQPHSPLELEQLETQTRPDLAANAKLTPRRSVWGLCVDLGRSPSAEEIDAARAELWSGFLSP